MKYNLSLKLTIYIKASIYYELQYNDNRIQNLPGWDANLNKCICCTFESRKLD